MKTSTTMTRVLSITVTVLLASTLGTAGCEAINGPQGMEDGDGTLQSPVRLADEMPDQWVAGGQFLGLDIETVTPVPELGATRVVLENPFLFNPFVAAFPNGGLTEIPCEPGVDNYEPITFLLREGSSLEDQALDIMKGFHGGLWAAIATFKVHPLGHCSAHGQGLNWWTGATEYQQYMAVQGFPCETEECDVGRCHEMAELERTWAQRKANKALSDDVKVKANIAFWMGYAEIIRTGLSPEDDKDYFIWWRDGLVAEYHSVLGLKGHLERTVAAPEIRLAYCLANVTTGTDPFPGAGPEGPTPNCSFSFGLGPVAFSWNGDGSWTLSGGAGAIVSITHNPSSGQTSVGISAGFQGHLGPYGVEGSTGMNIDLQSHAIEGFADVSLSAGPLSCTVN